GALAAAGQPREAVAIYEKGMMVCPESWILPTDLARLLATHPDPGIRNGPRALELLLASRKLAPQIDEPMATALAAAYASKGEFQSAITVIDMSERVLPHNQFASLAALKQQFLRHEPLIAAPKFS